MRALPLALSALLAGCGGAPSDPGLDAYLRVERAAYYPGDMPPEGGGPEVVSVLLSTNQVRAGEIGKPLLGALDPRATAVAMGLRGDLGYWIVPAGLPGVEAPDFPTFDVALSFSPDLPAGPHELVLRAVDAEDRLGPPHLDPLTAEGPELPEGELVISLRWDREADLDLHVVDPMGVEIYKRNINSFEPPPPGQPVDPDAWKTGALLDFDSNAGCVIDGRRLESVVWKTAPPAGHYVVRVDTFSLCRESFANWKVDVRAGGELRARAVGASGAVDEWMPHDRGAGVLAVELDLP
jgi:hypothetical protein